MPKHPRKPLFLLALVACLALAIGCSPQAEEPLQELRFMLLDEPTELDPTTGNESFATPIMYHVFEPLLREDASGTIVGGLAEAWEVFDENTRFVFNLRRDAKWSDGQGVTAKDLLNTYLYILGPTSESKNKNILMPYILNAEAFNSGQVDSDALGIKVIDDYTLEIKTVGPTPYFLNLMSFINCSPVRTDLIAANGPDWDKIPEKSISNGPYKLVTYEAGVKAIIEKNPYYWNQEALAIDRITFLFKQGSQDPVQAFLDGSVDGIYELDPKALRTYPELESSVHTHVAPSTSFMVVNHRKTILQNLSFRKALDMAIPRDAIVTDVISGAGIATNYLIPINYHLAGEAFHDFTALTRPQDIDGAKSALADLTATGINIAEPMILLAMDTGPDVAVANAIAGVWQEALGLDIKVEALPWGTLFERALAGDYDLMMLGFGGDYPHPMTFLSNFLKDGILTTILGWHDPQTDTLIQAALKLSDEGEALVAFRDLEKHLLDNHPIFNLYYRKKITLMSNQVTNWYRNSSSQFVFTNASIVK